MKNIYILSACLFAAFVSWAQSPRTVLLETRETTQLHAVAEGICAKEEAKAMHGSGLAVISFHDDNVFNGGDPMYKAFAANWATFFAPPNYPSGLVDRVSYNGNNLNLGISLWTDTIASRLNQPSFGLVTLPEVLYDPATDEIFVRTQVNFTQDMIENKDMRFFCYIVRDGVVADQLVDTTGGAPCAAFPDTVDTAYSFVHNDVAIGNPSGPEGVDNIIPLQVYEDYQFTTYWTFDLPNGVDIADVRVVTFVATYTPNDITQNRVVNAAQSASFTTYDSSDPTDPNHPDNKDNPNSRFNSANWPVGVQETPIEATPAVVYPNPVTDLGVVEFHLPSKQTVRVSMHDMTGKQVALIYAQQLSKGPQIAAFSAFDYMPGMYFIRVEGEGYLEQVPVVIAR